MKLGWIEYPCPRIVARQPAGNPDPQAGRARPIDRSTLGVGSLAQGNAQATTGDGVGSAVTEDFVHLGSVAISQWYEVRWLCCRYYRRSGGKPSSKDDVVLIIRKLLWVVAIGLLSAGLFAISTLVSTCYLLPTRL